MIDLTKLVEESGELNTYQKFALRFKPRKYQAHNVKDFLDNRDRVLVNSFLSATKNTCLHDSVIDVRIYSVGITTDDGLVSRVHDHTGFFDAYWDDKLDRDHFRQKDIIADEWVHKIRLEYHVNENYTVIKDIERKARRQHVPIPDFVPLFAY